MKLHTSVICESNSDNTSLNKFAEYHTDAATINKSIWFLETTNLETIRVKISLQSNDSFTSYIGFSDATFVILKAIEKSEFRVLIKHCFLMGKNTVQAKQCLEIVWDSWHLNDIRGQCIHHFAWTFGHEKYLFEMCTAFAHSRLKTTTRRRFRSLFGAVSAQSKWFFMWYMTMDDACSHYYTPESNRQSAEWQAKVENCPKRPKTQISAGLFGDSHGILFIIYLEKGWTINSEYYMA